MDYSSVAYLSSQFRRITGFSPTEFRKIKGKVTAVAVGSAEIRAMLEGKFATCPVEVDDVKMALQIVKAHSDNRSIRKRLFRASLSRDYLLELLRGARI